MTQSIQTFASDLIAVFRKKKKTYSILNYSQTTRRWRRFLLDPDVAPTISLWRQTILPASVKIKIDATTEFVMCIAKGQYLKYGNKMVTIVEKTPQSVKKFPLGFYAGEVTVTGAPQQAPANQNPLWTLYPVEQMVQPPQLINPPNIIRNQIHKPIPQHIAWLIAEDASKNSQDCPITLNPISPITASVTNCFHVFETEAIKQALVTKAVCPICRSDNPVTTVCFTS